MFNAKEKMITAFKGDSELISMLGKIKTADKSNTVMPSIYAMYSNSFDALPSISYYEANNVDDDFADDETISETVTVVIDIWNDKNKSNTDIFRRVDYIMKQLGFIRDFAADVADPNISHKTLRYVKKVYEDEEE